ncbi:MAG TPA: hypothetical protein VMH40_02980 [Myxococcaceae bacterium]|nr:hypothetical protein [Myxococcaceae bacterium]
MGLARPSSLAARLGGAFLSLGLLTHCAHGAAAQEREEREIRLAAETQLVRDLTSHSPGMSLVYCLGYVRILGEEPPIWELADEAPEVLAAVAALQVTVAPASRCARSPAAPPDGPPLDGAVHLTVERLDRPDPDTAVVRVALWRTQGTGPSRGGRGEGRSVRLARVAGAWEVTGRERTW